MDVSLLVDESVLNSLFAQAEFYEIGGVKSSRGAKEK
jgi:hypothetical protein